MKLMPISLSAAKGLAVLIVTTLLSLSAQAAAIMTLSGEAGDAKYETDSGIRISLIDWSAPQQQQAVEQAWRQYQQDGDTNAFLAVLEDEDTRGYLFTAAATGYRIKYAWQEITAGGQMMHFLVAPGLKTRNPYLWETPNNTSKNFTLVQVLLDEETGVAKSSLDGEIVFNEQGKLALDRFDRLEQFASMKDSTPYYLKRDK
jgi:hypothetical protein